MGGLKQSRCGPSNLLFTHSQLCTHTNTHRAHRLIHFVHKYFMSIAAKGLGNIPQND